MGPADWIPIWNGVRSLRIAFSLRDVSATADGETIVLSIDGNTHRVSRAAAERFLEAIEDALDARDVFLHTTGQHRADGAYVVSRRGVDSAGNRKVFDSFGALGRLYERLPVRFDAEDVGRTGISGSRRHMVVRHLAAHPAFDCRTVSRNPLVVEKGPDSTDEEGDGA